MCRFTFYKGTPLTLANLVTEPVNSVINQSMHSREQEDPLNGDGFGVAWYIPELSSEAAVFRSITPAWNNQNLIGLSRVTRSGCILAHVRRATPGLPTAELNCHPFASGPYTFMHNGDLQGFGSIRRRLLDSLSQETFDTVRGNTDSEHLFALFLERMRGITSNGAASIAESLEGAMRDALYLTRAAGVEQRESYLNIVVTDGRSSVATRFTTDAPGHALSLYIHQGRRYVCEGGVCRMIKPEAGRGAVIVSSERLSDDDGWHEIPPNHLVMVEENLAVTVRPVRID